MNKLKICAISDIHGYLPNIEPCELLFICGDISPLDIQFNKPKMQEWIEGKFTNWILSLEVDSVYLIPGNHDAYFESISQTRLNSFLTKTNGKLHYLRHEYAEYFSNNGIKYTIFGTPYCHIYGNWPFMRSDEYMDEAFKEIPDNVDFLLTHDTPYAVGYQDTILDDIRYTGRPEHVGNEPLARRLMNIKYKWLFHGHIHSSDHYPTEFNGGQVVNVSYVNERCIPEYEIFYTEIDEEI